MVLKSNQTNWKRQLKKWWKYNCKVMVLNLQASNGPRQDLGYFVFLIAIKTM